MELILGALVSLIAQTVKKYLGTSEYVTLAVVLVVALVASATYSVLVKTGMWETTVDVIIRAGAFYTFILARFSKGNALSKVMGNG